MPMPPTESSICFFRKKEKNLSYLTSCNIAAYQPTGDAMRFHGKITVNYGTSAEYRVDLMLRWLNE